MHNRGARDRVASMGVGVEADASELPALAETRRREGRLEEAEHLARKGLERKTGCLEGGVVLALALIDQGRLDEARQELERMAGEIFANRGTEARASSARSPYASPRSANEFDVEVTEGELDRAFEAAETDPEQVVDADRVAQRAMVDAQLDLPEDLSAASDPMFATETMAELLERQGDERGASRIRATLDAGARPGGATTRAADARRQRILAQLERWLVNLRSGSP